VYEVRPGVIRTPMTEAVAAAYEQRITCGLVPMQRWGLPQDIAHAVAALADGPARFSTGSVLHVDGALRSPGYEHARVRLHHHRRRLGGLRAREPP
jgi:NAD(P)-dependent dehydrogenase (short-subunit alcohol dehydrogenase family)